jgi:hypothetical protein
MRHLRIYNLLCLVAALLFLSCKGIGERGGIEQRISGSSYVNTKVILEPGRYVQWCQNTDNGLKKNKEIGDITYLLFYKPIEYVIAQELQSDSISQSIYRRKNSELEGLDYFDFKIQLTSSEGELLKYRVGSTVEYQERLNYFAFQMQKDLKMVEGMDTIDCELFHFERAYDVAPYAVFLLGFPKQNSDAKERTFFYQDNMFHKGIIKFTYTKEEMRDVPKLKTI